jgi:hypothetical protein
LKATGELVPLLNFFYHIWKDDVVPSVADGDMNCDGWVTIADALMALRSTVGLHAATATELAHGDCAPFVDGKPQPDSKVDIRDALQILRKVVKLVDW